MRVVVFLVLFRLEALKTANFPPESSARRVELFLLRFLCVKPENDAFFKSFTVRNISPAFLLLFESVGVRDSEMFELLFTATN